VAFAETALGQLRMKIAVLSEGGRLAAGSSARLCVLDQDAGVLRRLLKDAAEAWTEEASDRKKRTLSMR